jgi:amino acid transporter
MPSIDMASDYDVARDIVENRRDHGLIRAVGPWGFSASVVNIVVGAGIFAVPGTLAAAVGLYAPLAIAACGIIVGSVAICFAEAGSRVPTSGGAYGYVEAAFGRFPGYMAGVLVWFTNVLAGGGIAAALADVAVSVLPPAPNTPASFPPLATLTRVAVIVGVLGGIAAINVRGAAQGARFITVGTALKLIPLAVFVLIGAGAIHAANFVSTVHPTTTGLGRALILAVFAFTGMETSLGAGGEVMQPARNIPRGLALALLCVAGLYMAIQLIAQGMLGPALAHSTVPLAEAMGTISPALRLLMLAGAAVSMLFWLGSDVLGSPRILFGMARDGLLPGILGRVHPRNHVPHIAILCHAAIGMALALTGSFAELAVLSTLAVAPLYMASCAAALVLKRRQVAYAGRPLDFPALGVAATIGISGMTIMIALASRSEILGLFAVLALCALAYAVHTRLAAGGGIG